MKRTVSFASRGETRSRGGGEGAPSRARRAGGPTPSTRASWSRAWWSTSTFATSRVVRGDAEIARLPMDKARGNVEKKGGKHTAARSPRCLPPLGLAPAGNFTPRAHWSQTASHTKFGARGPRKRVGCRPRTVFGPLKMALPRLGWGSGLDEVARGALRFLTSRSKRRPATRLCASWLAARRASADFGAVSWAEAVFETSIPRAKRPNARRIPRTVARTRRPSARGRSSAWCSPV